MADTKVKRSIPLAQPKRRRLNYRRKTHLYEAVYDLNRAFSLTLEVFERLERQEFYRRDYLRTFRNIAEELRARANHELTAALRDQEQREAAHFGRLCREWDSRFENHAPAKKARNK
ncbi:MAG TPA: hypothetical protein VHA33_24430 [Candidatus Angelobacter sp.]|jgi:hypothetical protein|nr:hypothetical protein [Candidatus Angelobacter sp.]